MDKGEVARYLNSRTTQRLFADADSTREKFCGRDVHFRGIIEFSNYCCQDCIYCGLRRSNGRLKRYRIPEAKILEIAKQAAKLNCKTLVLQSGEDQYYSTDKICRLIAKIKKQTNCALTLSIGEKKLKDYRLLKKAGADRYLLKFETSSPNLYYRLRPGSVYKQRLLCLEWLKRTGYQVGSGFMVGLPGQTLEILADDILLIKKLELDMAGIGPFISHPDTPLSREASGRVSDVLKVIALVRILTEKLHLPATTALGTLDSDGWKKALNCGANVIMPNLTPVGYRKYYQIYPGKEVSQKSPRQNYLSAKQLVISLGRQVSKEYGHSLGKRFQELNKKNI